MTKQEKALKQVEFCFISVKNTFMNYTVKNLFEVNVAKTFCRPVLKTICVRSDLKGLSKCVWNMSEMSFNFKSYSYLSFTNIFQISNKRIKNKINKHKA